MKKNNFIITLLFACVFSFTSCEINDTVDNIAAIGHRAPNVYWEVPSAVINAGDSVEFSVQYWSKDNTVTYLGVWYDLNSSMNFALSYTGLYNVNYTYSKDSVVQVRDFQEIANYSSKHSQNLWVDSISAYTFSGKFPISYTLLSTNIQDVATLAEANYTIDKFIPMYMQKAFKQNLTPLLLADAINVDVTSDEKFKTGLKSRNLFNLLVVDNHLTDTATYVSSFEVYFNENSGRNESRIKPANELVNYKDTLSNLILKLPVAKLTYNNTKVAYQLQYVNKYKLNSKFKVISSDGGENYSFVKEITVN
jgi:hypothetical protein